MDIKYIVHLPCRLRQNIIEKVVWGVVANPAVQNGRILCRTQSIHSYITLVSLGSFELS